MAGVNADKGQLSKRFFTRGRYYSMHDDVLLSQGRAPRVVCILRILRRAPDHRSLYGFPASDVAMYDKAHGESLCARRTKYAGLFTIVVQEFLCCQYTAHPARRRKQRLSTPYLFHQLRAYLGTLKAPILRDGFASVSQHSTSFGWGDLDFNEQYGVLRK